MANQEPPNALDAWMAHIDQAQAQPTGGRAREMIQKASQKPRPEPPDAKK